MFLEAKVNGKVLTVYGYTRSIFSGPSSTSQQSEIENYFALLQPDGFAFSGFFCDPPSSYGVPLVKREAGRELDRRLKAGDQVAFSTLVVWTSRGDFWRTAEQWIKRGVGVHVVDIGLDSRTENGKIAMGLLQCCIEAFDIILPRERAQVSVAKKRSFGKALNGNPPLGFKLVGPKGHRRCVADPEEWEVIRQIWVWHKQGYSIDRIYFALIDNRVLTRHGREWGRTRIWEAKRAAKRLTSANGSSG